MARPTLASDVLLSTQLLPQTYTLLSSEHASVLMKTCRVMPQPEVTTDEIDRAVHKMIIEAGAYPSPLRYGACCKSQHPALLKTVQHTLHYMPVLGSHLAS